MWQTGLSSVGFLPLLEPSWQESSSKQKKLPHAQNVCSLGVEGAEICASLFFKPSGSLTAQGSVAALSPKGSHRVKKAPCF